MGMKYLSVFLAFFLAGCAHLGEGRGIEGTQAALAGVDIGADALAAEYVAAVQQVRAYCASQVDGNDSEEVRQETVDTCEDRYKVSDADVDQVQDAFRALSDAYDAVVEILPQVEVIKSSAEVLGESVNAK